MTKALISQVEMSNRRARRAAASSKKKPVAHGRATPQFLSRVEVLERVGVTFPTLWKWMREGKFPLSREIGPNRVGWIDSEVSDWMIGRPTRKYKAVVHA